MNQSGICTRKDRGVGGVMLEQYISTVAFSFAGLF